VLGQPGDGRRPVGVTEAMVTVHPPIVPGRHIRHLSRGDEYGIAPMRAPARGGHRRRMRSTPVPNIITAVRTVVAVALAVYAIAHPSGAVTCAAFATYWTGDVLDGAAARWLRQETRVGAVADIVSDRACTALCMAALLVLRPDAWLPISVFLVQFMVIDCLLSLSFLRWPLLSPNYFGAVHRGVYRWNWSPPAKAVNTAGVVGLVVLAPTPGWATAFAVLITVIKSLSLWTVAHLPTDPDQDH
jgi:CDP-diacylglycerol--glycerol-3-phosphate 3-phosphatidyltransferase